MTYDTICDGIDLDFVEEKDSEIEDDFYETSPVKYFTNELSFRGRLKRLLLRKPSTRLGSRIFDLVLKCMLCLLYILRVELDDIKVYRCYGDPCNDQNATLPTDSDQMVFSSNAINWFVLVWVHRPLPLWILQVLLSILTLGKSILDLYIGSKKTCIQKATYDGFVLDVLCAVPYIITVFYPPILMNLFVPGFMNCWLVRRALMKLLNDLHLTKQRFQTISVTLSQQLLILVVTLTCVIFTTICGIQHIQRGSNGHQLSMFEALYFVIVTFSTVGYGDISPDTWLGQLFMACMICLAFACIPRQVEAITSTLKERKKIGGEYSKSHAKGHKHVVVCATSLSAENIMDFLIEFYAHPKLEDHIVVLLSSEERDSNLQVILKDPKWAHRVIYMRGSALKDIDLHRCRMHEADACFILSPSTCLDRDEADQHTILRSWAMKDFAPKCKQYIQLFKTENKLHVKFAEHVVCQDEFKYALLANNCLYPGMSTLVTLLLHTTTGEVGVLGQEPWQQVYGRHSRNAVYHIQLCKSIFFQDYVGHSFTQTSTDVHKRFGVCLVAVLDITEESPKLQLNPGNDYKMKDTDYCFYIAEFKEEYTKLTNNVLSQKPSFHKSESSKNLHQISEVLEKLLQNNYEDLEDYDVEESVFNNTIPSHLGKELAKRLKDTPDDTAETIADDSLNVETQVDTHFQMDPTIPKVLEAYSDMGQEEITTGPPPPIPYVTKKKISCYILKNKRPACCLKWGTDCEHCTYKNARDNRWRNQLVILAVDQVSSGIHNFILPLRSHFIRMDFLSPIILLVKEEPDRMFLESIGHYPMVYWMQGCITNVDDLILAGIHKVSHLVIAHNDVYTRKDGKEQTMVDSETVVAVETIMKLFPHTNIITELTHATNIRFMQFQANNMYTRMVSKLEKKLREGMSSTMSHIFRIPFASGQVFSASMLDNLLYQTFIKGYLITFVRLLLGIDAEDNSGHLSSIRIKSKTLAAYKTYGELYHGMSSTTGEIPIAIYRTEKGQTLSLDKNSNTEDLRTRKISCRAFLSGPFTSDKMETSDLNQLVRNRMESLGMDEHEYIDVDGNMDDISYVILNPSPKKRLRKGDIVYCIQPSGMDAMPSKQVWRRAKSVRVKTKSESSNGNYAQFPRRMSYEMRSNGEPKVTFIDIMDHSAKSSRKSSSDESITRAPSLLNPGKPQLRRSSSYTPPFQKVVEDDKHEPGHAHVDDTDDTNTASGAQSEQNDKKSRFIVVPSTEPVVT